MTQELTIVAGEYAVEVGAGGLGGTNDSSMSAVLDGKPSSVFGVVANGGGGGGGGINDGKTGRAGASGGGGNGWWTGNADTSPSYWGAGTGTSGQGNNGGRGAGCGYARSYGGGGGGAGAVGGDAVAVSGGTEKCGNGGVGIACSISGVEK